MNKITNFKRLSGSTLLEMIVYVALFGVIFISVVQFTITMSEYDQNAIYYNDIERSSVFLNQHLRQNFREAKAIKTQGSVFDNDNGQLVLTSVANIDITYRLNNGRITAHRNTELPLIPQTVRATQLRFTRVLNTDGELVGVEVEYDLESVKESNIRRSYKTNYILTI